MSRAFIRPTLFTLLATASLLWTACSNGDAKTREGSTASLATAVVPTAAIERPIARFIRVTGTLTAEEQADVAAETAGRVIATPVSEQSAARVRKRQPDKHQEQSRQIEKNSLATFAAHESDARGETDGHLHQICEVILVDELRVTNPRL